MGCIPERALNMLDLTFSQPQIRNTAESFSSKSTVVNRF